MKNEKGLNITVKERIYLSFSILVLLFVVNGIITITILNNNKKLSGNIATVIDPSLQSIEDFEDILVESKMQTTNWVFLRSNTENKTALIKLHESGYPKLKTRLNVLAAKWDNKPMADSLQKIFSDFEGLLVIEKKLMASLHQFKDYDDPVIKLQAESILEDQLFPRTAILMNRLNKIVSSEHAIRAKNNDLLERSSSTLRILITLLAIIIIGIGIILSVYMSKAIINPINKIRHIVNDLGEGVIRKVDHRITNDQIGGMVHSVNSLSEKLQATATFARQIGERNFNASFEPLSAEDTLGIALVTMRDNIKLGDEKLNEAQHIARIGSWERNLKTDKISLSDEMFNIFEMEPSSDLYFESLMKYVHPDDLEYVMDISRKNLYMEAAPIECRIITGAGTIKNIFIETKIVLGELGEPEKTFGIIQDITERKQAENALKESESNLQAIFENASDGFILTDLNGDIKTFNNKAKEIFLLNSGKEIAKGESIFNYVREHMIETYQSSIVKLMTGEYVYYEVSFERSNGKTYWYYFSINGVYNNGKVDGFGITAKDITQTKEAENTLRKSEEQYRQIVETAQEGIWMTDENNSTILVNKKMADMLEYAPEEMMGKQNYLFMAEEWKQKTAGYLEEKLVGINEHQEFKYITKSGKEVWVSQSTNPVFGDDGTYKGALAMVTDITKRKIDEQLLQLSEVSLEIKNKELIQKNKELEQFAYVASHDLQEPLRTTASFVELLQRQYKGQLDENADKYLNYLVNASDRMQVLIKDLLDYSLIGSKKAFKKIDCNVLVQEVLMDLGTAIQESKTDIQVEKLPLINGYDIEIKQLFQNLITNAIKFRKKDVVPQIKISASKKDTAWEFAIKDNGIGINEQHKDRIFVIFQRLHTRTAYEGSGIGLSHCKKIVELHDGKIWLESQPGEGTTFYFTIQKKINSAKENGLSIAC